MTLNTCMQIFKVCSRKAESFLQRPGLKGTDMLMDWQKPGDPYNHEQQQPHIWLHLPSNGFCLDRESDARLLIAVDVISRRRIFLIFERHDDESDEHVEEEERKNDEIRDVKQADAFPVARDGS